MRPQLSDQALSICRENYANNCGGCPLRPVCVTHIGPGQEALARWTERVNEAAKTQTKEGES